MYSKDSPKTIQSMFDSIANRYDFANSVLSFCLHKRWNRLLTKELVSLASSKHIFVDLCAGTGDIALNYLKYSLHPCHAYLIDFSSEMLEYAQRKAKLSPYTLSHELSFIESNVQELPLPDHLADCVTIAYGIRNIKHPELCIAEAFRILKPGGCFGILELTQPRNTLIRLGHTFYLRTLMPLIGKMVTKNWEAYRYLCQSIQTFSPKEIENLLEKNGFINISISPLNGGIASILLGYKALK